MSGPGQGEWSDRASSQSGGLVTLRCTRPAAKSSIRGCKFTYDVVKLSTVFTTPEEWKVLQANEILISSRWGAVSRQAITTHRLLM